METKVSTNKFEDLKRLRDEARLQAHLFSAEMRTEFEKLEEDWKVMKRDMCMDQPITKSVDGIKHAAEPLMTDLRDAYERLIKNVHTTH